jgi:hypothetical protein
MTENMMWSLAGLFGLGAFHGINPGMGWLFAVALGLQERKRSAVWRALLPLTLGHALAIAVVVALAALIGIALPAGWLRWPAAAMLAGLGAYRIYRHHHPTGGGMRVGMGGLTLWSFLMASCHGAGLMALPVFLGMTAMAAGPSCHVHNASADAVDAFAATAVHGAGYLAVTALAAWVVFEKLGLGMLRKAWFNLDLIWAVALIATGVLTAAV